MSDPLHVSTALIAGITEKVRQVLQYEGDISPDQDLEALGFYSINLIDLIVDLEITYDFSFEMEELVFDNFRSPLRIASLVEPKLATR